MKAIHKAIQFAMQKVAKTGIAKALRNKDQGYQYRGIEDAMNTLQPILTEAGIVVTPAYSDMQIMERDSKSGGKLRFIVVRGRFEFASVEDGSIVTSEVYGEAMDSSDKATTKAQSVAFRTALFQQFIVPTMAIDPEDGDKDALPTDALEAAEQGMQAYESFYTALTKDQRKALAPHHEELKSIAKEAK